MAESAHIAADIRDKLIAEPEVILEDRDLMRALIAANERALGTNIVDLRGIAMERLEARLDRLEDTHRSVIAAAYENLAGEVAQILRVDAVRLVLESTHNERDPALDRIGDVLCVGEPGFIEAYMSGGRGANGRSVVLRQTSSDAETLYGESGAWIRSEAAIRLDLGEGRQPGMLALGAEDPHQFRANQGTDLLTFFGGVFERAMRRWLA